MKNVRLKNAIFQSGLSQRDVSRISGVHETIISRIVRGWMIPTPNQKIRIAGAIGIPVEQIFEDDGMRQAG